MTGDASAMVEAVADALMWGADPLDQVAKLTAAARKIRWLEMTVDDCAEAALQDAPPPVSFAGPSHAPAPVTP